MWRMSQPAPDDELYCSLLPHFSQIKRRRPTLCTLAKGDTSHVKYIINQQIKRLLVIALMIGYTYLQLNHIVPFNLLYLVVLYLVGLFVILIITHKIRIVSAHIEAHKQERHNHHD